MPAPLFAAPCRHRGQRRRRRGAARELAAAFCLAAAVCVTAAADEPPAGQARPAAGAFHREALLARFDADRDGRLDAGERRTLREAFGGIDVPLLPAEPYRYGAAAAPPHIGATQLDEMDDTPDDNPLTDHGAALGRVLFYDRHLSQNDTIACASCHLQSKSFTDPRRFSVGFAGGHTTRNAMSLVNLRYAVLRGQRAGFFWDERAETLEAQVLMPIQDKVEMGMELSQLPGKLRRLPYYPPLFEAAFGTPEITSPRVAQAVAQFMRAMTSFDSKFDRAATAAGGDDYARDFADFTPQENLGKSLFINGVGGIGEIGCAHCHMPPTFGMPKAFNNGLDLHYKDPGLGALGRPPNDPFTPSNDGKFKASSLRNVALTAPFMHDGRFATLEQVIEHYSGGVQPHENVALAFADEDAEDRQTSSGFKLSEPQKAALVAFLKTLTDESFLTDPRFSDPFVRLEEAGGPQAGQGGK